MLGVEKERTVSQLGIIDAVLIETRAVMGALARATRDANTQEGVVPGWMVGPAAAEGAGARVFGSFSSLKRALGAAGEGKQWHHIVGQTFGNTIRFGPRAIQSSDNLIAVEESVHRQISAFYSSKAEFAGGKTVREWLSSQSYEAQKEFGMRVLRDYGVIK